jgi:hypothetical protein
MELKRKYREVVLSKDDGYEVKVKQKIGLEETYYL